MTKNYVCHASYLKNHTSYDHHLCHMYVKWYLQVFFYFSKFRFFKLLGGVKRQKTVQNDKKFCLSRCISQEPYIIWLSFMVQMCKMIISTAVFFNFKVLIFQVVRGLKRQKIAQNDKIFLSVAPLISGPVYHSFMVPMHV